MAALLVDRMSLSLLDPVCVSKSALIGILESHFLPDLVNAALDPSCDYRSSMVLVELEQILDRLTLRCLPRSCLILLHGHLLCFPDLSEGRGRLLEDSHLVIGYVVFDWRALWAVGGVQGT